MRLTYTLPGDHPRRRVTSPSARRLLLGAYVVYLTLLLFVVFQPDGGASSGSVHLTVRLLTAMGFPAFTEWHLEKALNVVLFVPLGLLGAMLWPRVPWWAWVPIGLALSGFVEAVQGALLPQRVADVSDLVTNTAGTLLGALVTILTAREIRLSRRPETSRKPVLPPALLLLLGCGMFAVVVGLVLGPTSDLPTKAVVGITEKVREIGGPERLMSMELWEKLLNVLLFVPIGAVGVLIRPGWSLLRWGLIGFLGSLAIEMTQGVLLPGRDASLVDLATNTTGMLIGAAVVKLGVATARWRHRQRQRTPARNS